MANGDGHIWKPGTGITAVAECGYTHELDEETGDAIVPEQTGKVCPKCVPAPKPLKAKKGGKKNA